MTYTNWRHAFKIDPAKELPDADVEAIAESGTDGVIVGGSDGVTLENVLDLLARFRRFSVPLALEISTVESVTPGFDYYFIPTVLNAADPKWITGLHHEALREYGHMMNFEEVVTEGYCIVNPDCKAAQLTGAAEVLDEDSIEAYARMTEKLFRLPIFYLEYSGIYGDVQAVRAAKQVLENSRLFYGGGIRTAEQAREMAEIADTIVVGNIIYEDLKAALATVSAVKSTVQSW